MLTGRLCGSKYHSSSGDNDRLMSSEWSSIVSTLTEDRSFNGAAKNVHNNLQGPKDLA